MTDRDYAIKSLKEVTVKLARQTEDAMDCHYKKMKELLECYQELVLENQMVLAELEQECQEKLNLRQVACCCTQLSGPYR